METTYSGHWRHSETCNLWKPGHKIRKEFVNVLKKVKENSEVNVEFASMGCGCASALMEGYINLYWVAQGSAVDTVAIKYWSDEVSSKRIGQMIVKTADEIGVEAGWDGDPKHTVILGDDDYYD